MKTALFAACAVLGVSALASSAGASVLTSWSFEGLASSFAVTGQSSGNVASDGGTVTGNASGQHTTATTAYSSPAGNGSPRSLSSNNWTVGDYYQFTSSSTGFQNITIQWDQTGSATGPSSFNLFYSTDGSLFTQIGGTNTVTQTTWSSSTPSSANTFGPISAPAALDNQATIFFRIVDANTTALNGTTVGTGGTDRVDNVSISGTALPTPGAVSLLGLGGLVVLRRKR